MIPLRDGIHLSAVLYLPEICSKSRPAIFAMTPYVAQSHHERGSYFASHGHPFLIVDVRGRGNSEGTFHPLNDATDGYDVVEWLASQHYCNGKVAMWGGSYLGYCQWAVAGQRPPHLETIIPVAAAAYGVDFPLRKNVFLSYVPRWLTHVAGRTSQEAISGDWPFWLKKFQHWFETGSAFERLDALLGHPSPMFQEWISHPHRDEYWDSYNPSPDEYSKLVLPILSITGSYDADQPGALEHYRQHVSLASPEARAKHYLIIGPWDHAGCGVPRLEFSGLKAGPASLVDLRELQRQWYAWTMQGAPKPDFLRKNVAYYVMQADLWRYANSLDEVTDRFESFHLHSMENPVDVFRSGTLLASAPAAAGPDHYVYDPKDVSIAQLEGQVDPTNMTDQRLTHAMLGKQLVYHTKPFDADVEISGFFGLTLWLAIDQPDTDIRAVLYEIASDGAAVQLTADWVRARYREGERKARLIDTTDPLRYDFEQFTFISRRVVRGSRLRLVVGPMHSIHWQKNYNTGRCVSRESIQDSREVTVRLFHDTARPSALRVPIGRTQADEKDGGTKR